MVFPNCSKNKSNKQCLKKQLSNQFKSQHLWPKPLSGSWLRICNTQTSPKRTNSSILDFICLNKYTRFGHTSMGLGSRLILPYHWSSTNLVMKTIHYRILKSFASSKWSKTRFKIHVWVNCIFYYFLASSILVFNTKYSNSSISLKESTLKAFYNQEPIVQHLTEKRQGTFSSELHSALSSHFFKVPMSQ